MLHKKSLFIPVVIAFAALAFAGSAHAGIVVYENVFDGDDRGDNPGIGGGMDRAVGGGNPWIVDTGTNQLLGNARDGVTSDRGNIFTVNSFDLTGGFRLELEFSTDLLDAPPAYNANRVHFGIVATDYDWADGYIGAYLLGNRNTYGIGMSMTTESGIQGLNYVIDDAAGGEDLFGLSNDQAMLGGGATQTLVIEVDDTGETWSYSLDGAQATTGTFADADASAPDFDFTREYQIFGWNQMGENDIKIDSVKLEVIPEPASLGVFVLVGGLLWFVRRRVRA